MPALSLKKLKYFIPRPGPVLLVIMDGWGVAKPGAGNAVSLARTPVLDSLRKECGRNHLYAELRAHGPAVGLPSEKDMGNSEVGHNTMGGGRVFAQGAKLVNQAIASGEIFQTESWKRLTAPARQGAALHLIGLLSDGNVHSHILQLIAILKEAGREGVKKIRVHILLDGRDVPGRSALKYIDQLESELAGLNKRYGVDYRIASGGGRMRVTMDRYNSDWKVVKRGWDAHVRGLPETFPGYPGYFKSAREAVETARRVDPEINDQYNPSFVIAGADDRPVGEIKDGDSVLLFNFRGDRAIQISRAFEEDDFHDFERVRRPRVNYAGLLEYDGDQHIPGQYLVSPPHITRPLSQYLCDQGVSQYAIAETHKFGHVTYFWNGNFQGYLCPELEKYVEIRSDPTEMIAARPEMKAREVTGTLLQALRADKWRFLRVNFANGDMVGHTGILSAAVRTAGVVDECVGRLLRAMDEERGVLLITADHGNLEEMLFPDGSPKTSHSLSPVPFYIHDPLFRGEYEINPEIKDPGLADIAATILNFLGFEAPPDYEPSLIRFNGSPSNGVGN